jgi:hypothetical protein
MSYFPAGIIQVNKVTKAAIISKIDCADGNLMFFMGVIPAKAENCI